jgi:DNA modification methylase
MAGEAADMVFCDPPYGISYVGKTREALKIENDALGTEATRALVADSMRLALKYMKGGAAFYVCAPAGCSEDGDMGLAFRQALADAGMRLRQAIAWVKDAFVMGRQDYHWRHEDILYGWKEGAGHYFVNDRTQDTVWEIPRPRRSEEHPTMKPVELVTRALANSSRPGELVYEPFSGSGTTIAAAEKLGRRCYAVELDPRYVDVAVRRWEKLTGQVATLEGSGRTFAQAKADAAKRSAARPRRAPKRPAAA